MSKIIILSRINHYKDLEYNLFKQGEFFNKDYLDHLVYQYSFSDVRCFYLDDKINSRYTVVKENPANKKKSYDND